MSLIRSHHSPPAINKVIEAINELPTQQNVAFEICRVIDSDASAQEVATLVERDPTIAARLLRLANSAFYGLDRHVSNTAFAIAVVGFNAVRSIALTSTNTINKSDSMPPQFWQKTSMLAVAAGELAPFSNQPIPDAFSLGLLSTVGSALLWHVDQAAYSALLHKADNNAEVLKMSEIERYGMTNSSIAAKALRTWSLPIAMIDALDTCDMYQDQPNLSTVLATANEMVRRHMVPTATPGDIARLSAGAIQEDDVDVIIERVARSAESVLASFL